MIAIPPTAEPAAPLEAEPLAMRPCPDDGCGGVLDLHQPDIDDPDELVGYCFECGKLWQVSTRSSPIGDATDK